MTNPKRRVEKAKNKLIQRKNEMPATKTKMRSNSNNLKRVERRQKITEKISKTHRKTRRIGKKKSSRPLKKLKTVRANTKNRTKRTFNRRILIKCRGRFPWMNPKKWKNRPLTTPKKCSRCTRLRPRGLLLVI